MNQPLEDALQSCLEAVERGGDVSLALAAFPDLRGELAPLLEVALEAMAAGDVPVSAEAAQRSRTRALSLAAALRAAQLRASKAWTPLARSLTAALTALALVLVSGFGLLLASAQSLPGERLYPVKRAAEAARIRFTVSERDRLSLSISYDHRRLDEVRQLLTRGQQVEVEYEGVLTDQNGALWTVEGVPALATSDSYVEAQLQVGDFIAVQGHSTDQGWVLASSITAAGYRLTGHVDAIGKASWTVAGQPLTIVPASELESGIQVGDQVIATVRPDGQQPVAVRITLLNPAATTTPTLIPLATTTAAPSLEPREIETEVSEDEPPVITPTSTPSSNPTEDGDDHEHEDDDEHDGAEASPTPQGEETEFSGMVQSIDGSAWTIGSRTVTVNEDTRYEGIPTVGDDVRVHATRLPDGTLLAERIEVDD